MSALDNLIANIDKTAYSSVWDMDKIIGTGSGSFSVGAPTSSSGPISATDTFSTPFGTTYYFQGIYSTDGGVTWNDFNAMIPDLTTPTAPVLQTIDVNGAVGSSGTFNVIAFNYYDFAHSVGTARNILWKALFFSKNKQGPTTPLAIEDTKYFTSVERNYQKIAMKGEEAFNVTSGLGRSLTIDHNLGYVPMVRAFYQQTTPAVRMDSPWAGYRIEIRVTESQVIFYQDPNYSTVTATGNIEYRIYYDR